jgi:hypothetical protein
MRAWIKSLERINAKLAHLKSRIGTPRQWAALKRKLKKKEAV